MPQQIWKCEFCTETFPTEQECLEHERSHSSTINCLCLGSKRECEGIIEILDRGDKYELRFKWDAGEREISKRFSINKEDCTIEVKVIADKIHEAASMKGDSNASS